MKELFRSSLARRRARISKDFTSLLCFSFLGILRCCCILFDALIFQFFPSSRGCRAFSSVFILFFHFVWGNYNELKRTSFHHFTTFPSFSFSFCVRFPLFFRLSCSLPFSTLERDVPSLLLLFMSQRKWEKWEEMKKLWIFSFFISHQVARLVRLSDTPVSCVFTSPWEKRIKISGISTITGISKSFLSIVDVKLKFKWAWGRELSSSNSKAKAGKRKSNFPHPKNPSSAESRTCKCEPLIIITSDEQLYFINHVRVDSIMARKLTTRLERLPTCLNTAHT